MRPDQARFDRRGLIAAGLFLAAAPRAIAAARPADMPAAFAALEAGTGGRLGVCVLDTGSGRRWSHRGDERFPMCSTFKWLAVAAVLDRVDRGVERLDRRVAYARADLLSTSPVTTARLGEGSMPMGDLCAAAITVSDNAAANLILKSLGGPAGLTRWLRTAGDPRTRLDHNEPKLNTPPPGSPHDTTTPDAMSDDLDRMLLGKVLSEPSRKRLADWMIATRTGDARLRAGLPKCWRVGDKTGTVDGTTNDVAVAWPPGRPPILISAYFTGGKVTADRRAATLAEVGRIVGSAVESGAMGPRHG